MIIRQHNMIWFIQIISQTISNHMISKAKLVIIILVNFRVGFEFLIEIIFSSDLTNTAISNSGDGLNQCNKSLCNVIEPFFYVFFFYLSEARRCWLMIELLHDGLWRDSGSLNLAGDWLWSEWAAATNQLLEALSASKSISQINTSTVGTQTWDYPSACFPLTLKLSTK